MKKLASLLAATGLLACGQAFAFDPATQTPELSVTLSGASAQDAALLAIFTAQCDNTKPINVYTNTASAANVTAKKVGDYNAYSCSIPVANLTVGSWAARDTNADGFIDAVLYKRSKGGSGEATNGICGAPAVTAQLVIEPVCGSAVIGTDSLGRNWYKCATQQQQKSDGGLMDLELNKFPSPYNTVCDAPVNAGTPALLSTPTPIWGTIFNTPVSINFRNALQCAQGLTAGAEDEANMPNLPKEVVASAFNGGLTTWDKLQAKDAAGNYTTLAAAVASRVAAGLCPTYNTTLQPIPADAQHKRVIVCRRPDSSGTNTQFRVKFLNAACSGEAQDELADNTSGSTDTAATNAEWQTVGTSTASGAIIQASAGGDMANCLSAFADTTTPANQKWAIGHQSLENNVNNASNYRFIKIDGSAPTVQNVLMHKYSDWVESNWIMDLNASQAALDFQNDLLLETQKASRISALIGTTPLAGFQFSFGASGLVALNNVSGNVPSLPISITNPVATASHSAAGAGALSSCRTPQVNKVNTAF